MMAELAKVTRQKEELFDQLWQKHKDDLVIGKISAKDFLRMIILEHKLELDLEEVFARWQQLYVVKEELINWELLQLLSTLKRQGVQLHLLSNAVRFDEDSSWKEKVFADFTHIFRSYEIGLKKPDPLIYQFALQKTNSLPNQALFIDDDLSNVVASRNEGIRSHHFQNVATLKEELGDLLLD